MPYISHENGNQGLLECIRQFPTSFVFFHLPPSYGAKNEQKELYQQNLALFNELVTRGEHKCVFVDSELVSLDIPNVRHQLDMESTIMKFREQHPIVENHLKEEKRKQQICLAKVSFHNICVIHHFIEDIGPQQNGTNISNKWRRNASS